jgi:hypothetical protein
MRTRFGSADPRARRFRLRRFEDPKEHEGDPHRRDEQPHVADHWSQLSRDGGAIMLKGAAEGENACLNHRGASELR